MTPRYRTAFSVPSGFTASTPVVKSQPSASVVDFKARKVEGGARPHVKAGRDMRREARGESAAA